MSNNTPRGAVKKSAQLYRAELPRDDTERSLAPTPARTPGGFFTGRRGRAYIRKVHVRPSASLTDRGCRNVSGKAGMAVCLQKANLSRSEGEPEWSGDHPQ